MLTVYGIETKMELQELGHQFLVATVLTVYGIETKMELQELGHQFLVATVLTVYGIETCEIEIQNFHHH